MSSKYVFLAMEAKTGNPLRKAVLIALADNTDNEGMCFPSYQHIADKCEMSKRTVMIHVKALEELGFISKEKRHLPTGFNRSNVYRLMLGGGSNPMTNIEQKVIHSSESPALGGSESPAPSSESPALVGSESPAPITCHSSNLSLNHTQNVRAREGNLIPDDFSLDGDAKTRLLSAGVKIEVGEFLLDEFVNKNISTGFVSRCWSAEFASYCKRNEWRYRKNEEGKRVSQHGFNQNASQRTASVLERIKNL